VFKADGSKPILLLALVSTLASCGHSSSNAKDPAHPTLGSSAEKSAPNTPVRPSYVKESFSLLYDQSRAAAGFPSPFAKAKVNGVSGVFLIDTGAMIHVLSKEFAIKLRAAVQKTKTVAMDSTGTKVRLGMMVGALELGRFYINKKEDFFVTPLPPTFSKNKIDGILSPQLLHKAGMALALNLQQPSLDFVHWQQFIQEKKPTVYSKKRVTACVAPKLKLNRLFAVDARIAGKAVKLLLDTGANSTSISKGAADKLRLLAKARDVGKSSSGIGGKKIKNLLLPKTSVQFAGRKFTQDLRVKAPKNACPSDGHLGMSVLRSCMIAFEMREVAISCPQAR